MRLIRPICTAGAAMVLLTCGSAHSEVGGPAVVTKVWSKPVSLGSYDVNARPQLTFTGDGHAVAVLDGARVLVARRGARKFQEIARAPLLAAPASYGTNGVAYLRAPTPAKRPGKPGDSVGAAGETSLGVSLGTVPGSLGSLQLLARFPGAPRDAKAALAGNPDGDVAAAWIEPGGPNAGLRVALRAPGQSFTGPTTLVAGLGLTDVALAYGAGGDLVVVIERSTPGHENRHEIAVSVMRPGGAFGPIQSLGPALGPSSIAVAVSPTGDAVVAWGTQATYDGLEPRSPWSVRAAVLRSGVGNFSATQLLDPGHTVASSVARVSAAITPDGTATVAWSGLGTEGAKSRPQSSRPYPCPVRVATSRRGGRFGDAEQVARNGAALGIVSARDGTSTVLWGLFARPEQVDDYVESLDRIFASRRFPGAGRFARPKALSRLEPTVNRGAIALDPHSQRPAALWTAAAGAPLEEGLYDVDRVDALYAAGPNSKTGPG